MCFVRKLNKTHTHTVGLNLVEARRHTGILYSVCRRCRGSGKGERSDSFLCWYRLYGAIYNSRQNASKIRSKGNFFDTTPCFFDLVS